MPHDFGEGGPPQVAFCETGSRRPACSWLARSAAAVGSLLDGVQQVIVAEWLVRNSMAPAFMARTVIGMSPWPVMKTMGRWASTLASSCWRSRPLRAREMDVSTSSSGPVAGGLSGTPGLRQRSLLSELRSREDFAGCPGSTGRHPLRRLSGCRDPRVTLRASARSRLFAPASRAAETRHVVTGT